MTSFRTKSFAECAFSRHLLLRRWQTTSYRTGWRFHADWFLPEVRTVVRCLATSSIVPAPAAKSLGAARAMNGVSIGETMTDFRALFEAAEQSLDVDALQSLAEGWAEVAELAPALSCTDVYTGLATQAHFQRRLHEVSTFGDESSRQNAVARILLPGPSQSRTHCWTLLARLGEAVKGQLRGTGAVAMYQDCAVHVLFPLSEGNLSRLAECKTAIEALEDGALSPARMKLYPLSSALAATASTPMTPYKSSDKHGMPGTGPKASRTT